MALFAWYQAVLNVYWYYQRSWWAFVNFVLKVSHDFVLIFSSSRVCSHYLICQSLILGFMYMRLFVMWSRRLTQKLCSTYHPLYNKIVPQLAGLGPINSLGVCHSIINLLGLLLHLLCIGGWEMWAFSHWRFWCTCLLEACCMIHSLPLRGVFLGTFKFGNIVGNNSSLPCVVFILHWSGVMLIRMGWLGFGLGWLGVWRWWLIVYFTLLGKGRGRVSLVAHFTYGSALMLNLCLVWGLIIICTHKMVVQQLDEWSGVGRPPGFCLMLLAFYQFAWLVLNN